MIEKESNNINCRQRVIGFWKRNKTLFFFSCIIGVICHGYIMFQYAPTYSGINQFTDPLNGFLVREGKLFTPFILAINGNVALPWLAGIESIFIIAISICILNDLFGVRSRINRGLVAALFITCPVITGWFTFTHVTDMFAFAVFFATLAVYCIYGRTINGTLSYLLCIAFLTLAVGIYQSSISYFACVVMLCAVLSVLKGINVKNVFIDVARGAVCAIISVFH